MLLTMDLPIWSLCHVRVWNQRVHTHTKKKRKTVEFGQDVASTNHRDRGRCSPNLGFNAFMLHSGLQLVNAAMHLHHLVRGTKEHIVKQKIQT